MIVKEEDGLSKITRGPGPNGEYGWFIDSDGRVAYATSYEDKYTSVYDQAVWLLYNEGLTYGDVEYVTTDYGGETYTPEQFRRFANYLDWDYGYAGGLSLVGKGFYTYEVDCMGDWFYNIVFEGEHSYAMKPFWLPEKFEPPEKGEIKERWGLGDSYSERCHLWVDSIEVRDYADEEIADRVLVAMENMSEDSKAVPEKVYLLKIPLCREPLLVEGRGDDACRGYLQAAFDTRIHLLSIEDAMFFEPLDLTEVFSREDLSRSSSVDSA